MFHKEISSKHDTRKGVIDLFIVTTNIVCNHRDEAIVLTVAVCVSTLRVCMFITFFFSSNNKGEDKQQSGRQILLILAFSEKDVDATSL